MGSELLLGGRRQGNVARPEESPTPWVLHPHIISWITALAITPIMDCYWGGPGPNLHPKKGGLGKALRLWWF